MNSFDVLVAQRSTPISSKSYGGDVKSSSQQASRSTQKSSSAQQLEQHSSNNSSKSHSHTRSSYYSRKKSNSTNNNSHTYQTNAKKRNSNGAASNNNNSTTSNNNHNGNNLSNLVVNSGDNHSKASVENNRQYHRLNSNSSANSGGSNGSQNLNNALFATATTTATTNKSDKFKENNYDKHSTKSGTESISSSGSSSDCSSSGSSRKSNNSNNKSNNNHHHHHHHHKHKPGAMNVRSTKLMNAPSPQQSNQHQQQHATLPSPNVKAMYNYSRNNSGYLQHVNFLFGTTNSSSTNESMVYTNGIRYGPNGSGKGLMQTPNINYSNASISPPLSITSSGSSSYSSTSKSSRGSKSFNNSGHTMNGHRSNQMTPNQHHQQSQQTFYPSQNIPFYNSTSSLHTVNPMFLSNSNNGSSNHQTYKQIQFQQQNSPSAYHPNNNYHTHNRNYSSGNKKPWNIQNNNRYGNKSNKNDFNGNYSSSNSSNSSANSGEPSKKDTSRPSEINTKRQNSFESQSSKDSLSYKESEAGSPKSSPKSISLSDSEASNPKQKQLPPSDYFSFAKLKASSCTSTISLPVMSSPPPLLPGALSLRGTTSTLSSSQQRSKRDKIATNERTTSVKPNFNYPQSLSALLTKPNPVVNTRTMLTEDMLLNGSGTATQNPTAPINEPVPYFNTQPNTAVSESSHIPSSASDCSSIRSKFSSSQDSLIKRRSPIPSNRSSYRSSTQAPRDKRQVSANTSTKPQEFRVQDENAMYNMYMKRAPTIEFKQPPTELCNGSDWDPVSQKMWEKFASRQQTEETYRHKVSLWSIVDRNIKKNLMQPSNYGLYLVGSTVSGFALDTSDVDMCLVSRRCTALEPRQEALAHLLKLVEILRESSLLSNFNLIYAKVPILRFDDTLHHVEVDLNYNNCVGIRNSHLLYCYTQMDWRLQPLAEFTKVWAQYHEINNAKDLTISSYSLILMVIHYLQCGAQPAVLPCLHAMYPDKFQKINDIDTIDINEKLEPYHSDNNQTIGELFLGFLDYYNHFNFGENAISVRTASLLPIDHCRKANSYKNDPNDWKQLCIEEPFDLSNTARSCCDEKIFERIKKIFYKSWRILSETKDLDKLFGEPLAPPSCPIIYNNYAQIPPANVPPMAAAITS